MGNAGGFGSGFAAGLAAGNAGRTLGKPDFTSGLGLSNPGAFGLEPGRAGLTLTDLEERPGDRPVLGEKLT